MSNFGKSQLQFSLLPYMQTIIAYFLAVPLPDLSKLSWVSTSQRESTTYFKFDGEHLIYSEFNVTNKKWVSLLQKALDSVGVVFTRETLKSGQYTNEVFVVDKQYALFIAPLRRGGRGILLCDMAHVEYMREQDKQTRTKAEAKKKVLDTLTPAQRRALGL